MSRSTTISAVSQNSNLRLTILRNAPQNPSESNQLFTRNLLFTQLAPQGFIDVRRSISFRSLSQNRISHSRKYSCVLHSLCAGLKTDEQMDLLWCAGLVVALSLCNGLASSAPLITNSTFIIWSATPDLPCLHSCWEFEDMSEKISSGPSDQKWTCQTSLQEPEPNYVMLARPNNGTSVSRGNFCYQVALLPWYCHNTFDYFSSLGKQLSQ